MIEPSFHTHPMVDFKSSRDSSHAGTHLDHSLMATNARQARMAFENMTSRIAFPENNTHLGSWWKYSLGNNYSW